jgi:GNAT superfamily N-acetyltransferase
VALLRARGDWVAKPTVRQRTQADVAACARLLRIVHAEGQYPVRWPASPRGWLTDPSIIDAFVVDRLRQVLGHVAIVDVTRDSLEAMRWREVTGQDPARLAGVSRLFVRPGWTGMGLGTALLDRAVEEIRRRELMPVLDVVSASVDAIHRYEHLGWRLLATYPWGPAADGLRVHYFAAPAVAEPVGGRRRPEAVQGLARTCEQLVDAVDKMAAWRLATP